MNPLDDDRLDDALADLKAELSIEPSPEFAAKVRQRIDAAPARSFWNVWTWTFVAATCGVALVAGALWLRSDGAVVAPGAATTDPVSASSIAQHMTPIAPTVTPTMTPIAPTRTVAASHPRAAAVRETRLEVLVPPDQMIAIRQLMNAVRSGATREMPASQTLIDPETGELIKTKPIEIPLITVEPLPGTVEGRSGGRENR